MKKLLLLSVGLLALSSSSVKAQTGGPAVAVVTAWSGLATMHYLIDRGTGTTEQVDYSEANTEKGAASHAAALRQVVAKLYQEGYTLKAAPTVTTLIFVKEK